MLNKIEENRILNVVKFLDEKQKRFYLGVEAKNLGWGGVSEISKLTGVDRNTISSGIKEYEEYINNSEEFNIESYRIRAVGGGRKKISDIKPEITEAILRIVSSQTFGNPDNPLLWTTKSTRNISDVLEKEGFNISKTTVGKILKEQGYSLHLNQKMKQVGEQHEDRDKQFQYINTNSKTLLELNQPVCSIDCKKKENVGNFKNNGAEYRQTNDPIKVLDHDFPLPDKGKALPYGIYDINLNEGFVNVGISKDTAQFAVHSIRCWWNEMGLEKYKDANILYILADGGGSNSSRCRLWKLELQKFADEINKPIKVSHFPPGTSKWNKIEHRMFSQISKNWRGRPLESLDVIVNCIASTTTDTGLKVNCKLDMNQYLTGIKVTDEDFDKIRIIKDEFHGDWNYTIYPNSLC